MILIGVGLLFYYQLAGFYLDDQGWLVEPFWALGLGSMSIFLGSLLMVVTLLTVVFRSIVRRKNIDPMGEAD